MVKLISTVLATTNPCAYQAKWQPQNYDKKYRGDVTLRYALEKSLNVPAVYVAMRVGIPAVARTIRAFEIAETVPEVPAISLGALDTTLLNLTAAYSALANNGVYVHPRLYIHAVDNDGAVLASSPIIEKQVAADATSYLVTNILQGVIDRGTGAIIRREGFTGTAAGKTGTSDDTRDSWFIGYSPQLAAGVWIGNDQNQSTTLTGASGAGVVWSKFMQCAANYSNDEAFIPPPGVTFASIDTRTGKQVSADCPGTETVKEVYLQGTTPPFLCDVPYGGRAMDSEPRPNDRPRKRKERKGLWDLLFSS